MLLIIGIVVLASGVFDFVVAAVLTRNQTAATGGLGSGAEPPQAARILKRTGAISVLAGAVLTVLGLAA